MIRVSFSGGRTSGYLLDGIRKTYAPTDYITTFCNTGKEKEATLKFVRDVEKHWGVPITWLEYCRTNEPLIRWKGKKPLIGCHGFKIVTFETASRKGEPFEDLIRVKADYRREAKEEVPILPNVTDRWCSGELKARTMDRHFRSLGIEEYDVAVGLRYDEAARVRTLLAQSTQKVTYVCPLYTTKTTEADVLDFWSKQPFDLNLKVDPEMGTYEGNCDCCFLKRRAKLDRLRAEDPTCFDWWEEQEIFTGATFRRDRPSYGAMKKLPLVMIDKEGCDLDVCLCTD